MALWKSDQELFDIAKRELFTAVVGDVMDKMGLQRQFLPPQIRPLSDDMVVIGRAMPVLEADVFSDGSGSGANPVMDKQFGLVFEALDQLKPNEVYVCTGSSPTYALWGGLMSARAQYLKAAGTIVDGYSRDTNEIRHLRYPCFSYGNYAQDQGPRGKVMDYRVPIRVGEAFVRPGDILFGDIDGVCVVPREAEVEAFTAALEKARGEKTVKKAIEAGMSTVDAFKKYGIM
ncbi:MAG: RraA family protein [Dehalococcoidia bacterium]|jgi:regulator of RNase E activity RraA|nr:RraA family protein [Dehalococcoidia bacterium]